MAEFLQDVAEGLIPLTMEQARELVNRLRGQAGAAGPPSVGVATLLDTGITYSVGEGDEFGQIRLYRVDPVIPKLQRNLDFPLPQLQGDRLGRRLSGAPEPLVVELNM